WQKGSLFSIPLNAYHRLVNAASAPALLLCGTSAPNVMNVIDNTDFVFNCPYTFSERFAAAEDYFKPPHHINPYPIPSPPIRLPTPHTPTRPRPATPPGRPCTRRVDPFMAGTRFYL